MWVVIASQNSSLYPGNARNIQKIQIFSDNFQQNRASKGELTSF